MNKKKLLEDMAEEESRNDSKLVELQKQRETERRILNSRWFLAAAFAMDSFHFYF